MLNTVTGTFKKFFWYCMADYALKDAKDAILNDEIFLKDVKNKRNATIHLSKKHLPVIAKKSINDLLRSQQYLVSSMKYCFHGMDVLVSPK